MRVDAVSRLFPSPVPAVARGAKPVCTVLIDAEENFDWLQPVEGTSYSTTSLHHITVLHDILDTYGAVPAYLLTYPVLMDDDALRSLRRQAERGRCVLGLQLHTWVTPPFHAKLNHRHSYAGNLPFDLEERKLLSLVDKFVECFGFHPVVFRGGRYGFGTNTAALLEKHGFVIDTSVAPRTEFTDEGGPDYLAFDCEPFWFGRQRRLLELPLCRSVVGWGGKHAPAIYGALSGPLARRSRLGAFLTRAHFAERITLSPEGNDLGALQRLTYRLHGRRTSVLALSFHSSSLVIGGNPYVRSKSDVHMFYDRLSGVLDHLATQIDCCFASVLQVPDHLLLPGNLGLASA